MRLVWGQATLFATFVCLSGAVFSLLRPSTTEFNYEQGDTMLQLALALCGAAAFVLLLKFRARVRVNAGIVVLLLVPLFTALSVLWSIDPDVTLRKTFALGLTVVFAWAAATYCSKEDLLVTFGCAALTLLLLSVLLSVLLPGLGLDPLHGTWRGVFSQKNVLGRFATFAALLGLYILTLHHRRLGYALIGTGLLAVVMSGSTTSMVASASILAWSAAQTLGRRLAPHPRFLLGLAAVLVVPVLMTTVTPENIAQMLGKDVTISGRTSLWTAVLSALHGNELLGYGYGAFWGGWSAPSGDVWTQVAWRPGYSHNGLIELIANFGYLGSVFPILVIAVLLGLALVIALRTWRNASGLILKNFVASFVVPYLIFFGIFNFSEASIAMPNDLYWFLTCWTVLALRQDLALALREANV